MGRVGNLFMGGFEAPAKCDGKVGRLLFIKPKAGMELEFVRAFKGHIQWHLDHEEPWTWSTWEVVVSADRYAQYLLMSTGHRWEEFDAISKFAADDHTDFLKTTAPFMESRCDSVLHDLPEISRASTRNPPLPLRRIAQVHLHDFACEEEFLALLARVHHGPW